MRNADCRLQHSFLIALLMLLAGAAAAQPPALIHYQGRLTNGTGTPVITPQVVYFSLWSGGSATSAGSGTQLYREHVTLQPTTNGIIEHNVGSGTVDAGALQPSDFGTANPIFLQVEAGSPPAPLLPRTQVTSVGYAFYAAQAGYAPQTGIPHVTSVTDKTGGDTVIGDLIQIDGDGLSGTTVTVGGVPSPIVTRTATRLVCQVPAGIPMGLNPVAIIDQANSLNSVTVAHVNVHRLIVWVSRQNSVGNTQIVIVDALTGAKKAEFTNILIGQDTVIPHLQMAFANQGSLALVPSNASGGQVYAIDLTSPTPALLGTSGFFSGAQQATAVAVSPDNLLAVSNYTGTNGQQLKFLKLNQAAPPYSSSGLVTLLNNQIFDFTFATGFFNPRGSIFVGQTLVVCGNNNPSEPQDSLYSFRRVAGTNNFRYIVPPFTNGVRVNNKVAVGDRPFAIYPNRDRTRLYVMNMNATNLNLLLTTPDGVYDPIVNIAGGRAWGVAVSPDGKTLFTAEDLATPTAPSRIKSFDVSLGDMILTGEREDDLMTFDTDTFQLAAMDPVDGRQLAVGTNNNNLFLFAREGGNLALTRRIQIGVTLRDTYELQYQP